MSKALLYLLIVISVTGVYAQDKELKKEFRPDFIISGNLAGDASILSLGFDKLFFLKPALTFSVKGGLGFNSEFQLCSSEPQPLTN